MKHATLFYDNSKGWLVSYRTPIGFQHVKVASAASARPTAEELAEKGYEVTT